MAHRWSARDSGSARPAPSCASDRTGLPTPPATWVAAVRLQAVLPVVGGQRDCTRRMNARVAGLAGAGSRCASGRAA